MDITASDRSTLIRVASSLPKGSEERRAILAGLRQAEEKWIQDAVKRPGALSKRLGIPEDKDIPIGKIRSELAKLKKKDKLSADDKLFQKQLNFALTMKTKVDKKAESVFKQQMGRADKLDQVDPAVAKLIVQSGKDDGDPGDDVVSVGRAQWPAGQLKPSQTTMRVRDAIAIALTMLRSGKVGGDLGALVSKDNHILDGHHRWAGTVLAAGNGGKVGGWGASLPGKDLLKVLNVISKGKFNVRGGNPGSGDIKEFTEGKVRELLEGYIDNGIPNEEAKFAWSAPQVREVLEQNFGSVEAGIDAIAKNANLIKTSVPSWAPDRKQMPVIEEERGEPAETAKILNRGEVDWNDPHKMAFTQDDRTRLIRMASQMPRGSEERRAILAGLKTSATPAYILDQLGYDPFDTNLQQRDEEWSGAMSYAGRTLTSGSKKPITDRLYAIEYALDLLGRSVSDYGSEIHRAGGDWSKWRDAANALEKAETAIHHLR
jgi:hypothetical protein